MARILTFAVGVLLMGAAIAAGNTSPAPPAVLLDTTLVAPTGKTIHVPAGGDFQAALDAALPGDVITLEPGATYTGPFMIPNKSGADWITVRSATADSALPAPGTRITPADADKLPKIVGPGGGPAIATADGAHHVRFIAIEFLPAAGAYTGNLLWLGAFNSIASRPADAVPHDLVIDRCYVHGDATVGGKRGIMLNGARIAVIDTYLSDWKGTGMDTQAIAGWDGPGPFKIVNNYIEGSGENVMFGGAVPTTPGLVPSDIEFRRNHVAKNPTWNYHDAGRYAGQTWEVKNLFELKSAQRVLVDGNVFEDTWADAQDGFAILLTVRGVDGQVPWAVVQDVTFTNNVVRHAGAGIDILGQDDLGASGTTERILIRNNVFDDIGAPISAGSGVLLQMLNGAADVTFDHNTAFQSGSVIAAAMASNSGFVFTNNIAPHNTYGVWGDGVGTGLPALESYFPGYEFHRNVLAGGSASNYPADEFFPPSIQDVGFVDLAGRDYHLATTSPYRNAATDGRDIGANIDALDAAQAPPAQ